MRKGPRWHHFQRHQEKTRWDPVVATEGCHSDTFKRTCCQSRDD